MELGNQIKKYRSELQLSQDQLAEHIYVSRQTISNWENEKSYPDVNSLVLLSEVFKTSIDNLIKGDIENMKEKINEQEIKKFNYYGNIFTVHLVITLLSAVPLFFWLERLAFIPFGILFVITMYWALKVEKVKKDNDIQTYKEIVAFSEGKRWKKQIGYGTNYSGVTKKKLLVACDKVYGDMPKLKTIAKRWIEANYGK